ncbi:MAG: hypothetical protein H0V58_08545 [Actinobacteria bacterium]|nr:hypothetical protein [Actinomycetota bacterium]
MCRDEEGEAHWIEAERMDVHGARIRRPRRVVIQSAQRGEACREHDDEPDGKPAYDAT